MPLFRRSRGAPGLVRTDAGWQSLDEVFADAWQGIAAAAWEGYQTTGRGFVIVGFNPLHIDYRTIADMERWSNSNREIAEFRQHLSRYKPDREVLALVKDYANNEKEARAGGGQWPLLTVPTPPGSPTPSQAHERQRIPAAGREYILARQQQTEQAHALLQEGLDPDKEPFVYTDTGWQRLHFVLRENWESVAAAAWRGYQQFGRGTVIANFVSYDHGYFALDEIRDDDRQWQEDPWPEVLGHMQQYNPQRELVFVTKATGDGRDMRQSLYISREPTPRGALSPPEAAGQMQPWRERQERGLDPDSV
jgi:hypothetical protein